MKKERIDVVLVEKGLVESRSKAKEYINNGHIYIDNKQITKPSTKVDSYNETIEVRGEPIPYVGRGGLKLEKALKEFDITVADKIALDIGASTGGFTDCMLQFGAKKVYAIDVGQNQLSSKLRKDNRVVSMEKTNVRYMTEEDIKDKSQFVSIDVSFISLKLVLPVVERLTHSNADIVALIKPQFEAGKDKVGKNGIVKNKKIHLQVIKEIYGFCDEIGLYFQGLTFSPVKGGDGNREYLVHLSKNSANNLNIDLLIDDVVNKSHNYL